MTHILPFLVQNPTSFPLYAPNSLESISAWQSVLMYHFPCPHLPPCLQICKLSSFLSQSFSHSSTVTSHIELQNHFWLISFLTAYQTENSIDFHLRFVLCLCSQSLSVITGTVFSLVSLTLIQPAQSCQTNLL